MIVSPIHQKANSLVRFVDSVCCFPLPSRGAIILWGVLDFQWLTWRSKSYSKDVWEVKAGQREVGYFVSFYLDDCVTHLLRILFAHPSLALYLWFVSLFRIQIHALISTNPSPSNIFTLSVESFFLKYSPISDWGSFHLLTIDCAYIAHKLGACNADTPRYTQTDNSDIPRTNGGLVRAASFLCDRNHDARAAHEQFAELFLHVVETFLQHQAVQADLLFDRLVVRAYLRCIKCSYRSSIFVHIHSRIRFGNGI